MAKRVKIAAPAPTTTTIDAEGVIRFPLPAGQNPDDPYYEGPGQHDPGDETAETAPLGPAECAAALEKLGRRSTKTTSAAEFVQHWAERTIEACPKPNDKKLVARSRNQLAVAVRTLNDSTTTSEAHRQAADTAMSATFIIGRMLGAIEQALHARRICRGRAKTWRRSRERSRWRPGAAGFRRL
jgi:hypothetical protein